MKIQIDTEKGEIILLDDILIEELMVGLKALLGKSYKKYIIKQNSIYSTWTSPTIYPYYPTVTGTKTIESEGHTCKC